MSNNTTQRAAMAIALEGLSVGDAFGQYALADIMRGRHMPIMLDNRDFSARIATYEPPASATLHYTDDTEMAFCLVGVLNRHQQIDQDLLIDTFARYFTPQRGYGPGMLLLMAQINAGADWRVQSQELFQGTGSFGNGGAMRAAPLGAYFSHDLALTAEQAALAASVTHAHPEGIAGGVAIALGAAVATQWRLSGQQPDPARFFDEILAHTPESAVREGIASAAQLPASASVWDAAIKLGNGSRISAQDTVPLTLWCASHHLASYESAIRRMASALGDIDTNCAIVGGIVASYTGDAAIPANWRAQREPLPTWPFETR